MEISLLIFGGLYLIYVIMIGGDRVFPYFRFFMVILPNLYLLIGWGTELIWEICTKKNNGVWVGGAVISIILVTILVISVRASVSGEYWERVKYNSTLHEDWALIGKWLKEQYPPDTWTAMWRVGMIPYYSGLPTIDMLGLTDRHIAGCPSKGYENLPGHEKHDFAYVLNRKPVIILYWDILFDEAPETLGFHSVKHSMIGFQELARPEVRKQFEREYTFRIAPVEGKYLGYFIRNDLISLAK